jgi:hypothetical protein
MTALEILEINLKECEEGECLNNWQKTREIVRINKQFVEDIVIVDKERYIPLEYYIDFLNAMPEHLWCLNPVFYYNSDIPCWDGIGFLGEKIHKSTVRTKYLQLCFDKLDISITEVLDNKEEMFIHIENNKERFLHAIKYLKNKLSIQELKYIYIKSKKLSDEKFIIEQY